MMIDSEISKEIALELTTLLDEEHISINDARITRLK